MKHRPENRLTLALTRGRVKGGEKEISKRNKQYRDNSVFKMNQMKIIQISIVIVFGKILN